MKLLAAEPTYYFQTMAIYLINEITNNGSMISFTEFDEEKLERGKHLLATNPDFSTKDKKVFENNKKLIQFSRERIQVDQAFVKTTVLQRLVEILDVKCFLDDDTEFNEHPVSKII